MAALRSSAKPQGLRLLPHLRRSWGSSAWLQRSDVIYSWHLRSHWPRGALRWDRTFVPGLFILLAASDKMSSLGRHRAFNHDQGCSFRNQETLKLALMEGVSSQGLGGVFRMETPASGEVLAMGRPALSPGCAAWTPG